MLQYLQTEVNKFLANIRMTNQASGVKKEIIFPVSNKPKQISLLFSHRCLFKCKQCFLWKRENNYEPLKLDTWSTLLKDLKKIYGSNLNIQIGGDGMAEINEKLITIIKTCSELGLHTVFTTNAYLVNRRILKRIVDEAGLKNLLFSLDYMVAEKHDNQRGIKYSYKHVLDLLEHVEKYENLEIVLSCIIMKPNLDEILDIVKFVDQLKQVDRVFFQVISQPMGLNFDYNWYKDKKFCFLWPDKDKAARIIDELITLKKNGSKIANSLNHLRYFKYYFLNPNKYIKDNRCNAEDLGMEIGIDGNVSICNKMRNLGSLKKHSISELLAMNYKSIAGEISNCSLNCHQVMNCRFSEE